METNPLRNVQTFRKYWLIVAVLIIFVLLFSMSIQIYFESQNSIIPIRQTPTVKPGEYPFGDNPRRVNALDRIENITVLCGNKNISNHSNNCLLARGRRILINFAAECCEDMQKKNCETALKIGGFDVCILFRPESIDSEFKQQTLDPLLNMSKHSFGFSTWKPYIILKYSFIILPTFFLIHNTFYINNFRTLLEMNDDDYLCYSDSDFEFIANVNSSLIRRQEELGLDIVLFHSDLPENAYTKGDAFILTGCDTTTCRDSYQILSNFLLLRRSFTTIEFISEWLTYSTDPRAISDQASELGENAINFIGHRHDQSLLSLLAKKWGFHEQSPPNPAGNSEKAMYGFTNYQYIKLIR